MVGVLMAKSYVFDAYNRLHELFGSLCLDLCVILSFVDDFMELSSSYGLKWVGFGMTLHVA